MRYLLCAVYAFMGAVLFAVPNLTRRELLFGVPVAPGFRDTDEARHAITAFRAVSGATTLIAICALLLSPGAYLDSLAVAVPFAIMLASMAAFFAQHRRLKPFAAPSTVPRGALLSPARDRPPRFVWLATGPYLLLASAAVFLHLNWNRIPERFPVHFDAAGHANRWAERTVRGVYGPLIFGAELCTWMLAMGLAAWFGSRRTHFRRTALGAMIAIEFMLGGMFSMIAVQTLVGIPFAVIILFPLVILIPLIAVMAREGGRTIRPRRADPGRMLESGSLLLQPE